MNQKTKRLNKIIPFWKTHLGKAEAQAAKDAILKGNISLGQLSEKLEKRLARLLDVPFVVMTTSGSSAILMALIASGVQSEDEVILPNRTFIATAHAPLLLGARVRLIDCLEESPLIDPLQVEKAITKRTKAIIPVHLNGRSCDLTNLLKISERYNVSLIEDAAQAMFSRPSKKEGFLGTHGDLGCFSLGVTKFITSGQGGFVVTRNKKLYKRLKLIRIHGVKSPLAESFNDFGFNFRYTDMQAAVALKQIDKIPQKKKMHIYLYNFYREKIKKMKTIRILEVDITKGELPLWIEIVCENRDKLFDHLKKFGIQCRKSNPNLNDSPHIKQKGSFPRSAFFKKRMLALPCGPDQDISNIKYTIKSLESFEQQQNLRKQ